MKTDKIKLTKRNPFVSLAIKRKAGSHRKTNKQLRAMSKREGWDD